MPTNHQMNIINGHKGGRPSHWKKPGEPGIPRRESARVKFKEKVIEEFRMKTMRAAAKLFNSQLSIAVGVSYLFKIEKYYEMEGGKKVLRRRSPKLVTNPTEIEAYLAGLSEHGELVDRETTYYYFITREPSNKAIDSLLDRTFGKPQQFVDFSSGGQSIGQLLDALDAPHKSLRRHVNVIKELPPENGPKITDVIPDENA